MLRQLARVIPDDQRMQYLAFHYKPTALDILYSHSVTKRGKIWSVKFQHKWLEKFPWLSYSSVVAGGLCRYCTLFPEQPRRGDSQGAKPGVLVLFPYQKPYTKALGKDGILVCHEKSAMHQHAAEQADLFKHNFRNPDQRIDSRLIKHKAQQEKENKEILRQIVLAVEFLAKQGLPLRGDRDDKVDFAHEDINRGNFIAVLQLLSKGNISLQKHLQIAKQNANYTSKTIQNEIIRIYASKIRETHCHWGGGLG